MQADQEMETGLVDTGLTDLAMPEPTPSNVPSEPVTINGLGDDVTVKVAEINHPAMVAAKMQVEAQVPSRGDPTELQPFSKEMQEQAENENTVRNFMQSLHAARNPEPKVYTPPPVSERMAEQTRLEMEAGRKRVEEFDAMQASRPRPTPIVDPREGTSVPVFRPADFVPDQRKGQGNLARNSARNL